MSVDKVSFLCNCGEEIIVEVKGDDEYSVACSKCGQKYRFTGASVLRWGAQSRS